MYCPAEAPEFKLMLSFLYSPLPIEVEEGIWERVLRRRLRSLIFHMGAVLTLRRRRGGRLLGSAAQGRRGN